MKFVPLILFVLLLAANVQERKADMEYLEHGDAPEGLRKISGQAHKAAALLVDRDAVMRSLLEASGVLERVWIQPQDKPRRGTIAPSWFGSGTLLLRAGRQDQPVNANAGVFALRINAATNPQPGSHLFNKCNNASPQHE